MISPELDIQQHMQTVSPSTEVEESAIFQPRQDVAFLLYCEDRLSIA